MPLYRPPSEGRNLIVQATYGCSFNRCTFCSMYKSKEFCARPREEVFGHIDLLVSMWPDADRVFLADGDAMCLPFEELDAICDKLAASLPNLSRITIYSTPRDILRKSEEELKALRAKKLSLIYLGVESGSDQVLAHVSKGVSQKALITAINKAMDCGFEVSCTAILGLGGKKYTKEHAKGTAEVINNAPPTFFSTLQLALEPHEAPGFLKAWKGQFEPLNDVEVLEEMADLMEQMNPPKPVVFRSNHASNCLPLAGTMPKDLPRLRAIVAEALAGQAGLRPQWMRGF